MLLCLTTNVISRDACMTAISGSLLLMPSQVLFELRHCFGRGCASRVMTMKTGFQESFGGYFVNLQTSIDVELLKHI